MGPLSLGLHENLAQVRLIVPWLAGMSSSFQHICGLDMVLSCAPLQCL